jgi:argininosuccinate lyase
MPKRRQQTTKPWGGRFREGTHPAVERFTASVHFDRRLAPYDIQGSMAHARMLAKCGILTRAEAEAILRGLRVILREVERGAFPWDPSLEDVHMNIEARLTRKIGAAGGKLHTARSRNDQVALDLRLYLRDQIQVLRRQVRELQGVLLARAGAHLDVILPGYTHLQPAQPVLLAHHLLAYFEMFQRDRERLASCLDRVNVLPLGAGALAGTTFAIDPHTVAADLGFARVAANSLDAVADRDFVAEFLACAALLMMHLSRLGEEIVLWASAEFGFVTLPDALATGSSMMPQKKNPDVAELARGKAGRVYGALMGILTVLKGLPLSYNRDLQEDKEGLFDAVDTAQATVTVMAELLRGLRFRPERMRAAAAGRHLNATDVADYLAAKGVPFRAAHAVVGRLVRHCLERGCAIEALPLEDLRRFSPRFGRDVYEYLTLEACVARRASPGGTAPAAVRRALRDAANRLKVE